MPDFDDPEVEALWNTERRNEVVAYLQGEGMPDVQVDAHPAWSVAPYVSIWAVEAENNKGVVAWWAICGDLPNDYVSAKDAPTPREAVRAIASLWAEAAQLMYRGERHPTFIIGSGDKVEELAPMLESRAALLLEWVDDSEVWEETVN